MALPVPTMLWREKDPDDKTGEPLVICGNVIPSPRLVGVNIYGLSPQPGVLSPQRDGLRVEVSYERCSLRFLPWGCDIVVSIRVLRCEGSEVGLSSIFVPTYLVGIQRRPSDCG